MAAPDPVPRAMVDPHPDPPEASSREGVMTVVGQVMTRTSVVYAVGMASVLPLGMVSLAVTTRYLDRADFGRLSILFAIASVMTLICGLGFMQGAMMAAYGMAGDDDGDADGMGDGDAGEDIVDRSAQVIAGERRRILGSGVVVVAIVSTALCGAVALAATPMARLALGDATFATAVRWMAASAWAGALWRMVHQFYRLERRAVTWSALQWLRPVLVLAATVVALHAGAGIDGALAASAIGTAIATVVATVLSRRLLRFAPRWSDVGLLWTRGKIWVPLSFAGATQANASVLVLAAIASPASVAAYQIANRLAQVPVYFAEGFLAGWGPAERSQLTLAARDRKGIKAYQASIFTLMCLGTIGFVVLAAATANLLILVVAPGYRSAAQYIPLLAVGHASYSVFRGIYRATRFPRRIWWLAALHLLWVVPYGLGCLALSGVGSVWTTAGGQVVAGIAMSFGLLLLDHRGGEPTPFQWRRLGVALTVAAVCVAAIEVAPSEPIAHAAVMLAALVAFPSLLVALRVLPVEQLHLVLVILRSLLPTPLRRSAVRRRLARLPAPEREAVLGTLWDGRSIDAIAERAGAPAEVVSARVVRGLRTVTDGGPGTDVDHLIGHYVVVRGSTLERDVHANALREAGVDSLELHRMEAARTLVTSARRRVVPRRPALTTDATGR